MLNALLVEDNLDLAATVVQYLELEDISCDHASNGAAGLSLLQKNDYEILLLDLNLPRIDGLTLCQELRDSGNDLPILMLTARDQLSDKLLGFEAGTDDYLVKPFELQELVMRIRALSRRRSGQAQLLTLADLAMNLNEKQVSRADQTLRMSPIAWKLLEKLLRASPDVVSRRSLEVAVWGDEVPDSDSLKVHMYHLRKLVDAPFKTALIHTLPGHGFVLKEMSDEKTRQP